MFWVIQDNVLVLRKYIVKYLVVKEYNVSNIIKFVCVICVYYIDGGSGRGGGGKGREGLKERMTKQIQQNVNNC